MDHPTSHHSHQDPQFLQIVGRIFDISARHDIVRGLPAVDYDTAKYWIDRGVQFFECNSELDLIRSGAKNAIRELHRARGVSR